MTSTTESVQYFGALASAPASGILLGSAVAPMNEPCGPGSFTGAECLNWFDSDFLGMVGTVNPDVFGTIAGLMIGGAAAAFVYLHNKKTGTPQ